MYIILLYKLKKKKKKINNQYIYQEFKILTNHFYFK